MRITSPAFEDQTMIPTKYTCDGEDISPPLRFENVPEGAKSLGLVMDDPDAPMGTFDHWVVWNIPASTTGVGEDQEPEGVQGINGFGVKGYGGPCPPRGVHRYFFRLYALDATIDLPSSSRKKDLGSAMKGHIIDDAVLVGRYTRQRS